MCLSSNLRTRSLWAPFALLPSLLLHGFLPFGAILVFSLLPFYSSYSQFLLIQIQQSWTAERIKKKNFPHRKLRCSSSFWRFTRVLSASAPVYSSSASSGPFPRPVLILETTSTRHPQTNQSMSFGNSHFSFGSQMKSDCLEIFLQPRIRSVFLTLCVHGLAGMWHCQLALPAYLGKILPSVESEYCPARASENTRDIA